MHDNELLFTEDVNDVKVNKTVQQPWKVIVADDEEEVHIMTKMVMRKFQYENRGIQLLTAYSGEETKRLMRENEDVAIVLLDVVMEHEDSGLEVVKYIRDELENPFVRIILRTGQPGQAPQDDVIRNYDINDYKSKTELTVQKLYTAVIASLRSYMDMRLIDKNRRGLELILSQSRELFNFKDSKRFVELMLEHYLELLAIETGIQPEVTGLIIDKVEGEYLVSQELGVTEEPVVVIDSDHHSDILALIEQVDDRTDMAIGQHAFVINYSLSGTNEKYFFLKSQSKFTDVQLDLIKIYANNAKVALDNANLNSEIIETQKEVIITLGEIVETRSKETANHVVRVAEYSYTLARLYGLSEEDANLLRLASPMHDIGKVGIPDQILNKPGRLTPEEFEIIKTHTQIGYEVLKPSNRPILKTAAMIAIAHHERWDGGGYPNGLVGEEIDVYSRITSIADVYDALSHKRVYKEAWPHEEVIKHLKEQSGKMFQPELVALFLENIDTFVEIRKAYPDLD
jgi:response regulator RpfG family c-di-GMP phosphodiesterase